MKTKRKHYTNSHLFIFCNYNDTYCVLQVGCMFLLQKKLFCNKFSSTSCLFQCFSCKLNPIMWSWNKIHKYKNILPFIFHLCLLLQLLVLNLWYKYNPSEDGEPITWGLLHPVHITPMSTSPPSWWENLKFCFHYNWI